MKFAKTFCKPSSCVSVVPAGLPVKLQYNEHGLLQSFRLGFSANLDPMYEDLIPANKGEILDRMKKFVPNSISTKGGTTWVYGVFYSDKVPMTEGSIPFSLTAGYIDDMLNGGKFEFYAGYAHSLAASFQGAMMIRNFLSMAKFNLLPQVVVPVAMQDQTMESLTSTASYPFNRSFVAGYFVYEELNCRYVADTLMQIRVSNEPTLFIDNDGYWKAKVLSESLKEYVFSYSAILHHNVTKGCALLIERENEDKPIDIIATRLENGAELVCNTAPVEVKCPVCGKINRIGQSSAPVQCDDPYCLSHEYPHAVKMLSTLGLDVIDQDEYNEAVKNKDILCLTDILSLDKYKDIKIEATLADVLRAAIPVEVVPHSDLLERFANKCNNDTKTVTYYLENPLRLETDLDLLEPAVRKLADWLKEPYNMSTIQTLFDIVEVSPRKQKFEGDPIFRGNTFVITGKFKRGDYNEIASIIESYAAKVIPAIEPGNDLPDLVITGSLNDGISGQVIQKARLHGIPMVEEDTFFAQYEIDDDLQRNLL